MSASTADAIDCDIHPSVPSIEALLPYMADHWRDTIVQRGVHELETIAYPVNAPLSARPDLVQARGPWPFTRTSMGAGRLVAA